MTAPGGDILAWLDHAITAREQAANAASGRIWRADEWGNVQTDQHETVAEVWPLNGALPTSNVEFITTNDPESVLRRCAADRKLLELHQPVPDHGRYSEPECPADCDGQHDGPSVCMACRDYAGDPLQAPCHTLLALAEGYGWTEGER